MRKLSIVIATLLAVCTVGFSATPALAFNPFEVLCNNNGSGGSALCNAQKAQNETRTNPLVGAFRVVAELMAVIAGVTAVIIILIAGFSYILSGGDPAKIQSARERLTGVVVGLVIMAFAGSIISLVLGRL